jgi:hypothetical protein
MHRYFFLVFIPFFVHSDMEETTYKPTMLHLENEYPIDINFQNGKLIEKNNQNIEQLFGLKRFHWEYVLGALIIALLYLITQQQQDVVVDSEEIARKQRQISRDNALGSLVNLDQEKLPEKQQYDLFYEKITRIVRKYIEETYALNAPTQTTEEFLRNISSHPIFDKSTSTSLGQFLQSADAVKFSEHTPSIEECERAQNTAETFILK